MATTWDREGRTKRGRTKNDGRDGQSYRADEQEGSVTSHDILSHTRRHHPIPQGLARVITFSSIS